MIFDIMTLFPELVGYVLGESIIGRAQKSGAIEVNCHNIRDYSEDKHRRVDDTPYGGGKGMLMAAPPIYNCYKHIIDSREDKELSTKVVFMSPSGKVLDQKKAEELSHYDRLIILCGHYGLFDLLNGNLTDAAIHNSIHEIFLLLIILRRGRSCAEP